MAGPSRRVIDVAAGRLISLLLSEDLIRRRCELVCAPHLRDQRDLPVLAAAVGGHADLMVTGDKDLLVLREFQGIGIVNPVEPLRTLGLD